MAKMRKYKNGIFGHRYNGYYITREEYINDAGKKKMKFAVIDEDRNVLIKDLADIWDAEWEIDKMTASPKKLELMKELYNCEIYVLTKYFSIFLDKELEGTIRPEEKEFLYWVEKIRIRKIDKKPF